MKKSGTKTHKQFHKKSSHQETGQHPKLEHHGGHGDVDPTIWKRPAELLQHLIRFNTSNPPGDERDCVTYINHLLHAVGIKTHLYSKDAHRPNLVARLKGEKSSREVPPLLIYGHVDVVPADGRGWTHPPFEAKIADGFVWGRGALDMKGGIAMMICAFIKAKMENVPLPGDVILCILSDEEELGEYGARFLVEHHPELFKGVHYALGEFGGFTLYVGGKKFYPIEIAQKQKCVIKAVIQGESAHGSHYVKGGTMVRLAEMLQTMDSKQAPAHVTPAVEKMFSAMAQSLSFPMSWLIRQLLNTKRTKRVLKLMGEKGNVFVPMFHNIYNPTVIHTGDKINMIPGEIEVVMDARLLPGYSPDDAVRELREILGPDIKLEVQLCDGGPKEPDMGMYDILANIIKEEDPEGIPIPLLLTGSTDARFFSRMGIQTYGFLPMQLPEDMNFNRTVHSIDERIPVDTLPFGIEALLKAMQRVHG